MAVPTTGNAITLGKIYQEIDGSGYSNAVDPGEEASLEDMSENSTPDLLNTASANRPDENAPHSMSEFHGYDHSAVNSIPTTNFANQNGTTDAAFTRDAHTSGIVVLSVYFEVRMRRADPYVYLEIKRRGTHDFTRLYSSPTDTFGTAFTNTYVTMARWNLTGITAIKMNWNGPTGSGFGSCYLAGETNGPNATYNADDDTFRTVSNNQSIAFAFASNSSAECYASNVRNCSITLTATARKSGYADTTMGTYKISSRATATSNNCF